MALWTIASLGLILLGAEATAAPPRHEPVQPMNFLPAIAGDYFPLASVATGVRYHIYVSYAQGYAANPAKQYPVVYLLDGDSSFPLLAAQHLFLTIDDKAPEAIIVGIAYGSFDPAINKRDTDFGPRAADFSRFLAEELIPAVESRARADSSRRILVGQSFGAGYVLYSALNDPDLFWARIASNPSFRLREDVWGKAAAAKRTDLKLYLVDGTLNDPRSRQATAKWGAAWSRKALWTVERIEIPGGTHAADLGGGYRAALRKLFHLAPVEAAAH